MNVANLVPSKKTVKKAAGIAKNSGVLEKLKPGGDVAGSRQPARRRGRGEAGGRGRRPPHADPAVRRRRGAARERMEALEQVRGLAKFMHRIESAEKSDPKHVHFTSKIWGIRREWDAEITEKRTHETIAWSSEDGLENAGVVTFHRVGPRLTHIELNIDVAPHGPIEKMARGMRFAKRAVRADLHRFKAYAEQNEA